MNRTSTYWETMQPKLRRRLVWSLWLLTWFGLLGGLFYRQCYDFVVLLSAGQALLFVVLFGYQARPLPVQVRLAYLLWVIVGSYVPYMLFLMYITTVGLAGNLFFGYCPLARMLLLCPWNRTEQLSFDFVRRLFLSPPSSGRFDPEKPARAE